MILTCEKCSTSFNLDDSLVKQEGSKVRCSVCGHIFTAFPRTEEAAPDVIPAPVSVPDTGPDLGEAPSDAYDSGTEDFFVEEEDLTLEEPESPSDDDSGFADTDFSDDDLAPASLTDTDLADADLTVDDLGADDLTSGDLAVDDLEEIGPVEVEMEGPDLDIEADSLEFEDDSLEMAQTPSLELEPSDGGEDFSFDDEDFDMGPENGDPGLELEEPDETDDFSSGLAMTEADADSRLDDALELDSDESSLSDDTDLQMLPDEPEDEQTQGLDLQTLDDDDSGLSLDADDAGSDDDEEFELEFDVHEEDAAASDEIEPEPALTAQAGQEDAPLSGDDPPEITPEDDFSAYDDVLDQETEPDPDPEETIEIDDTQETEPETTQVEDDPAAAVPSRTRRHKKKKPLVGTPVLILLLLFLLVLGAWVASIMTGYKIKYLSDIKIPYIEKYLKKPAKTEQAATLSIDQENVKGRFVTNATAGTLFVITGKVENPTAKTFRHVAIKGSIFVKGSKTPIKTKQTFCGNIATEEMLKNANMADITALLARQQGNHDTNLKIKPGSSIRFMVVFSDLPEKLENYNLEVHSFETVPAT